MSNRERKKKDGQDKGKKLHRMREDVARRHAMRARSAPPGTRRTSSTTSRVPRRTATGTARRSANRQVR